MFDVTRFNENIPGLRTFQDGVGDIRTVYTPGDGMPVIDINFSNLARKVLSLFGLEEPPMEKYGVANLKELMQEELADVQSQIKTIEGDPGMTKEASARLDTLKTREKQLVEELNKAE